VFPRIRLSPFCLVKEASRLLKLAKAMFLNSGSSPVKGQSEALAGPQYAASAEGNVCSFRMRDGLAPLIVLRSKGLTSWSAVSPFRAAANIVNLRDHVSRNFALKAQVVLVGIRRVDMRVHEIEAALVPAKREKLSPIRRVECGSGVGWPGGKWVGRSNPPWRTVKGGPLRGIRRVARADGARASGVGWNARVANAGFAIERWRAVELQVVFALQDVIEDTEAAAKAGLAATARTPGKTDARSKVGFVRKIGPTRRPSVSGKNQTERRRRKSCRLISGDDGIGSSLSVNLRRTVLIAKPQTQGQVGSYPPLVLRECVGCLAADVAGRIGALKHVVRGSHEEVGQAVASSHPARGISVIAEAAVAKIIVECILLIVGKSRAEFPVVVPAYPRERIRIHKRVADFEGRTVRVLP